ncbi:hypothetical protein SSP24_02070 [Streptomyces spinoverrucosus]|uniref:Uncharacterized protein n=1 Tax=Streptomyces spinoverrucosus TaxID=284043 RepID=A0A4Y3V5N1_9ACTN|nr:hypothetical protein SSP24_02070 [Streptomyces spinoverrucosus]GHB42225.1 hypothetical protein GCM10010397_10520 [Streptomyces spinoverrucosus]
MRGQPRQPAVLPLHLALPVRVARQPDGQFVAEPEGGVVQAGDRNRGDRKDGPLRELGGEQTAYEGGIDQHPDRGPLRTPVRPPN